MLGVLLLGAPFSGAWLTGKVLSTYWVFPPQPDWRLAAPFSWSTFLLLSLLIVAVLGPLILRIWHSDSPPERTARSTRYQFPWWGWPGLGLGLIFWTLAWTRFDWFADLQPHTFTPLWLGYILCINALCFQRSGSCMLLARPGYFLALFPTSALLWTAFEYLNLFVRNWYYTGTAEVSAIEYLLYTSLPFSTVLPAVLGTAVWLQTWPRLVAGLDHWVTLPLPANWPFLALLAGASGLIALGAWPELLYPLLWIAPLALVWGLQAQCGQETPLNHLARGDWRSLWLPSLATLLCGFFWEMWNTYSLAHWHYAIPGVGRFYIFEMPLLGYAGYLPFGLFCVAVAEYLLPATRPRSMA